MTQQLLTAAFAAAALLGSPRTFYLAGGTDPKLRVLIEGAPSGGGPAVQLCELDLSSPGGASATLTSTATFLRYRIVDGGLGGATIWTTAPTDPPSGGVLGDYMMATAPSGPLVAVGAAILFDIVRANAGTAINLTAPGLFTLAAGTYEVEVLTSVDEAGQWMLRVNGVELGYTAIGRAALTDLLSLLTTITVGAGDTLEVVNPSGNAAPLTLTASAGGTHAVFESISIKKLS